MGIEIKPIKPGNPPQNRRHERNPLTLKAEATRPAGMNFLQQQARFDDFVFEFNAVGSHEALALRRPADLHAPSERPYRGLPEVDDPLRDRTALVATCGPICMRRNKINISPSLAGPRRGAKESDDALWLVSLVDTDLGSIDPEQKTLHPSTIRSARGCHPCDQNNPSPMSSVCTPESVAAPEGFEPPTLSLGRSSSIHLSYGAFCNKHLRISRSTNKGFSTRMRQPSVAP